ncbi:hypothetical protein C808_03338 [Lachnospiraceae bacterium M18-1]|nr:hypothetical protein C808_03338 [Lachnospiraceae bacterium M18-1]
MELISAAIGILGVIIGWGLNELTTIFRGRPKLCFQMVATPENELTEKAYRVKESSSEHGIEIFNVGEKPFVLESFVICHKKKILVDCQMPDSDRIILPSIILYILYQNRKQMYWNGIVKRITSRSVK